MKITVNGRDVVLEKDVTVNELLVTQKVEMPEYVTVQINDELIAREDFETLLIKENDTIEFLYFMGGGTI
jgi:sulfur carrier protein